MNAFEVFSIEPSPWPDLDAVKDRYLEEAARLHPDAQAEGEARKGAEQQLAELNRAHEILQSPKLRLALLFQIETGREPSRTGRILGKGGDLLMKVAMLCRKTDLLLQSRMPDWGVVEAAMFQGEAAGILPEIGALQEEVAEWRKGLEEELASLRDRWKKVPVKAEELEALYQNFSFCEKARSQLEERFLKLADCLAG